MVAASHAGSWSCGWIHEAAQRCKKLVECQDSSMFCHPIITRFHDRRNSRRFGTNAGHGDVRCHHTTHSSTKHTLSTLVNCLQATTSFTTSHSRVLPSPSNTMSATTMAHRETRPEDDSKLSNAARRRGSEDEFDTAADAGAAAMYPIAGYKLRRGGYLMINDHACVYASPPAYPPP